jgi:hypothetical protein
MKIGRWTILFFSLTAFFCGVFLGQAQKPSTKAVLEIAGAKLSLGMTEAQVDAVLQGVTINKIKNVWLIEDDKTVEFTDGKLTFARRAWTVKDNDIMMPLYGLVGNMNREGYVACRVYTTSNPNSWGLAIHRVLIDCGEKSILISRFSRENGGTHNEISEVLGSSELLVR